MKVPLAGLAGIALGIAGGWWIHGELVKRETALPPVLPVPERLAIPPSTGAGNPWAERFDRWVRTPELDAALIGFCLLDEKGGIVYQSPLAGTALCPASALKTVTAGAALGVLGESFRFETRVMGESPISQAGLLPGNLVLKGGGDPTLEAADLESLADELARNGLKRVGGDVVADATIFPEAAANDHWVWGDLGNAYGAGAFGINVGRNVVSLAFDAGKEGTSASFLGATPLLPDIRWDTAVTAGPVDSGDGVMIYSSPYATTIQARGTVPAGSKGFVVRGAVPDPPALGADLLKRALSRRGVKFGTAISSAKPSETTLVSHQSASLVEIIGHMQRVSDNLEAQCLFLTIGRHQDSDPVAALESYWRGRGIDFKGLRLLDGSGLARASMIRPLDLARVNYSARHSDYGDAFFRTLPASSDGTLRSKRGAMSGVRTEVGFLTVDGQEFTFALMANGLGPEVGFWKLREGLLEETGR